MTAASNPFTIRPPDDFVCFDEAALNLSLAARFEQIVARAPHHLALVTDQERFTYQELNQAANRVAHAIQRAGGAVGQPLAIMLGQNARAICAIWGALKAGCPYALVSPAQPRARASQILEHLGAERILTENQYLPDCLAAAPHLKPINLDRLEPDLPTSNPNLPLGPEDLAYLVYTSGSTGAPKGVIHLHQNVMCATLSQVNDLCIAPSDRIALFISLGYDASRFGVFGAGLIGATLCLYDTPRQGINGLVKWIDAQCITVLHSTSSIFRHVMSLAPKNKSFNTVRAINLGGEPATSFDVRLFHQHFSRRCSLSNSLGSTETQTIARYTIGQRTPLAGASLPVGYALFGKHIELQDEACAATPPGEVGEIVVRSRYISPGYWQRPDPAAASFAAGFPADPQDPRRLVFHTGDLGRMSADGCLEHYGRKDAQIKVRGNRVELAEVEAALFELAGVRNAAVLARPSPADAAELQILAYVELEQNIALSRLQIHNALAQRLPGYMLPALIVLLEKLPLTATGKVDRQALPTPEATRQAQERSLQPASNPLEAQLVELWEQTLNTRPVGVQDNFFELGGNSLLAAQLFNQVERRFHRKLPLALLFQTPTIAQLAVRLSEEDWTPDWSSLVALQTTGAKPPVYFAAPVGGNVLSYRDLIARLPADQPCYGLQAVGLDGVQTPKRDVAEIASHYIHEIQSLQPHGPYYLAGSSFGGLVVYEMAQQLHDLGQETALVVMFDAYGPNYPKRMPGMSRLKRRIFKLFSRAATHLSNLQYANWPARLHYLRVKTRKLFTRLSRQAGKKFDQLLHPLPAELKKVRAAGFRAGKRRGHYQRQARRFGGRLVLFRASNQPFGVYPDPTLGWGSIVGADLEVYEIPGHHTSLIYEPRVHLVADRLRLVLAETQAAASQPPIMAS